jgi:hypothetical protein
VVRHHKRPLSTRILQGVAVSLWVTLFWYLVRGGLTRHLSMRAVALLLLTVAVAGAAGGGAYYATDRLRARGVWHGTAANLITLAVYFVVAFALLAVVSRWL